jgi:hypothetical protein
MPLVMQGEQPYFGGSIVVHGESIPAWFILDVGAADTITFTTPFIAEHHLLEHAGDGRRHAASRPGESVGRESPAPTPVLHFQKTSARRSSRDSPTSSSTTAAAS